MSVLDDIQAERARQDEQSARGRAAQVRQHTKGVQRQAMTLLYESRRVTVWAADARTVLPTLETESVDCVVTDPPYGMEWQSNTRKDTFDRIEGDGEHEASALVASIAADLVRVTRRTRHIYTFGLPVVHPLLQAKAELVWDKERLGSGDLTSVWSPSHERIYFHVRAQDRFNAANGGKLAARLRRGSVIRLPRLNAMQVKRHPTEKPVELMRQLIESSSVFGEVVLDPFAGVGSTLVAAILEGRRAIGVEIDERYAAIAVERVKAAERIAEEGVAA